MNKFIYAGIILLSVFIINSSFVNAQNDPSSDDSDTPTPTSSQRYVVIPVPTDTETPAVTPTPLPVVDPNNPNQCGYAHSGNHMCCPASSATNVGIDPNDRTFCINMIVSFCLSDVFNNITHLVTGTMGLDDLDGAQICNEGIPNYVESTPGSGTFSCTCVAGNPDIAQNTKLCSQYIVPQIIEKKHLTQKIGVGPVSLDDQKVLSLAEIQNDKDYAACFNCFKEGGYYSGIGCIYTADWKTLLEKNVFGWGMGLAGIIAIGCITFAAIQFQLSQGDTEKIKKARELMTSCIMGLILIIFSVFILRVIGVDILQLPGLGK
jgi:hypothetical protein